MNFFPRLSSVSPLIALLLTLGLSAVAEADEPLQFDQRRVDPKDFVLMAAPDRRNHKRRLVILEQVSDRRSCWTETGIAPTLIDPVMLDFNAEGICAHRTNASGYSIRVAEQDLAWHYQLEIIEHNGELLLLGKPKQAGEASLLIARSQGAADFAKLELLSGWRLTQRMYRGHALPHLYLSQNRSLAQIEDPLATEQINPVSMRDPEVGQARWQMGNAALNVGKL